MTTYTYSDPFIAGWTDEDIKDHFRLGDLPNPTFRIPFGPSSIVVETRNGTKGFRVEDLRPGGASLRVRNKRTANRIADIICADYHQAVLAASDARQDA